MNNDNIIKMKIRTNDELKIDVNAGSREVDPVFVNSPAYTITYTDINYWNNKSDFSGSYTDLTNKPFIPTKLSELSDDMSHRVVTDLQIIYWNNKSNFSGNYNDLTNKPLIPTLLSQLEGDSTHRVVTDTQINTWNNKSDFSGSYTDLTDKPTIPSKTSDLTNDSNFVTNTDYSSYSSGGVVKCNSNGFNVNSNGWAYSETFTYAQYLDKTNAHFISKGTLENVFTGKEFVDKTYVNKIGTLKRAFGDIFTSSGTYTATMYGNLVGTYIGNGIWKIDYEGGFEYSDPGSNYYDWGLSITKINTLLGLTLESMTNTPTLSSYISYGTNGGLNTGAKGFATCYEYKSSLNALLPARYYNNNGDIGGWGLGTFASGSAFYATIYLKEE